MNKKTGDIIAVGVSLMVLVVATCWLPYQFHQPSDYVGGGAYGGANNGLSYLSYLVFLIIPAVFLARLLGRKPRATFPEAFGPIKIDASPWPLAVVGFILLLFSALYAYKGRFLGGDAVYFQTMIYRMSLGDVPYLDFSFAYGPLMLYPAYWLAKVVGLDAGYGLWLVANYLFGLLALYAILRTFLKSSSLASFWFVFLAIGLFNPWATLNYTPTRSLLPSLTFFVVFDYLEAGGWKRSVKALIVLSAALTYSFECALLGLGVTFLAIVLKAWDREARVLLSFLSGALVKTCQDRSPVPRGGSASVRKGDVLVRGGCLLVAAGAISLAFFYAIDPTGKALAMYPGYALSYVSGAYNLRVTPNPSFLLLMAATVFSLGATIFILARERASGLSPTLGGYLLLALMTQRGAFGVSEVNHLVTYGLPIYLLAIFLGQHLSKGQKVRRWLVVGLLGGLVLPLQHYNLQDVLMFVHRPGRFGSTGQSERGDKALPQLSRAQIEARLAEAVLAAGKDRAYIMFELEYYSLPIYQKFSLRYPSYFNVISTAMTEKGMKRIIREVRSAKAVVVIRREALDGNAANRNDVILRAAFVDFVRKEYRSVYERDGIVALELKSDRDSL